MMGVGLTFYGFMINGTLKEAVLIHALFCVGTFKYPQQWVLVF